MDHYDTHSSSSRHDSPNSETDSKNGAPARKRVPVACDRCRKRKIKCSGDEGGNRGCSNCRNAGYTACAFLRVSSSVCPIMLPPYQMSKQWANHRFTPYARPSPTSLSYISPPHHYQNVQSYASLQPGPTYHSYAPSAQPLSWTRDSYAPGYGMEYNEEEISSQYPGQPPSYMLPNNDPMNNMSSCYLNSNSERISQNGLWSEHVGSGTVPSSNGAYVASTYAMPPQTDPGGLQALHAASLGAGTTDRTLPTPAASRGLAAPAVSSLESLPLRETVPSSALSHRSSLGWNTDSLSSTSHVSSRTSISLGQGNSDQSMIVGTTHDLGFGWTSAVSHAGTDMLTTTASVVDPQPYSPYDNRASIEPELAQRCRTESCESLVPMSRTTTGGGYDYRSSSQGRYSILNSSTSARLVDGQEYTIMQQHPTARHGSRVTECQQGCSECQDPHDSQHVSVASTSSNYQ